MPDEGPGTGIEQYVSVIMYHARAAANRAGLGLEEEQDIGLFLIEYTCTHIIPQLDRSQPVMRQWAFVHRKLAGTSRRWLRDEHPMIRSRNVEITVDSIDADLTEGLQAAGDLMEDVLGEVAMRDLIRTIPFTRAEKRALAARLSGERLERPNRVALHRAKRKLLYYLVDSQLEAALA